jgi:hypothetical protein
VDQVEPLLASWNARDDPAQIRLQAYLQQLGSAIGDLPAPPAQLFLHMDVDVVFPARLLRHYDLENYLTPVVQRLGQARFVFVSAKKRVGGGSRVTIGIAESRANRIDEGHPGFFSCHAGRGAQEKRWKAGIRAALAASEPTPLPPGPVEVRLAWRCSPSRNWVSLWKPTGDAMGPVLGEPDARNPFNPNDDRIVNVGLHRISDSEIGHDVDVAMWWRQSLPELAQPGH